MKEGKTEDKSDKFYEELKSRVKIELQDHGIDPIKHRSASFSRKCYYLFVFICVIMSGRMHMNGSVIASFLFALAGWLFGSLGHDGGHYSVSRNPIINDLAVWGMFLIANPMMWQHQHTYAHHSHTNDFDHDPDLHHFTALLRVHRKHNHEKKYVAQSNPLFVVLAYTIVVFGTALWIPFDMMVKGSLYNMVTLAEKKRPIRFFMMVFHTVAYSYITIISPFLNSRSVIVALLCVVTHIAASGLFFGFFSQINHLNEKSIEHDELKMHLKGSWAAKQVITSNNFATKSFFWHIFSNGLNQQIEHHLFPGLNHEHLHIIAPIVQKICEEFHVPYKAYESYSEICRAGLEWLNTLSKPS